jgi:glycosyltransferase involved in cell wall biosynthesis
MTTRVTPPEPAAHDADLAPARKCAKRKFVFLTNIPAPYRVSMYNALARHGLDFEVFYMRHTEADRSWSVDRAAMQHRVYIDRGFYAMLGHYHLHFNPRLLVKLLRDRDAEIIVGGGWNDVDVLILVMLKRLGLLRNQLHFWSEANYLTIGARRDNALKRFVRKFVYNSSTGAQLSSGKMTELTMTRWGLENRTFIPLPNTIEEVRFDITEADVARRQADIIPTFLMPVRLAEKIKGIINFFESIGDDNVRRARFLLAGDGPDREAIQGFIESRRLQSNIVLLGFIEGERMVSLYKRAHAVVLPSYSDPSPLTLIEALKMRLPLLASDRCGNHFETVIPGTNGYVFDPADPASVKVAFESLMRRIPDWPAMGVISADLYQSRFAEDLVVRRFIEALESYPTQ